LFDSYQSGDIYKEFMINKFVEVLFFDIKAAYDNINPIILFDINSFRIKYKLFIKNLIMNRVVNFYELGTFQEFIVLYKRLSKPAFLTWRKHYFALF